MADKVQQGQQQGPQHGPQSIAALYEAMAAITEAMLAAALAEEWDQLVALEIECAAQVVALQRDEPQVILSKPQQQRKAQLIAQMLAADADIRRLAGARMTHLSDQISNDSTARKLSQAYGG